MLLTDRYPPFGDSAYPASLTIVDPATRDRRIQLFFDLTRLRLAGGLWSRCRRFASRGGRFYGQALFGWLL